MVTITHTVRCGYRLTGKESRETFYAVLLNYGQNVAECSHDHRTESAADKCGKRLAKQLSEGVR